ncbi:MAG: redox-regulated ATPase YchF [Patescibacteria group bacterium]|nr:redox-regulated ATPase YchF [Patescibacteria group bacterium]
MSLHVGIVGLPNVGKSTLFQAITKKEVDCANYPFCTIDPNIGVVAVPDERIDKLAKLTSSAKKIYTTVEFVDIAGLVKGASKGEGLGNKFLANIREVDAVLYILRCFENKNIINTQSTIDVFGDKEILDTEMILKDLETIEKRIDGLEKELKSKTKEKNVEKEFETLKKAQDFLQKGELLSDIKWDEDQKKILNSYQLLTIKPKLFLLNGSDGEIPESVIEGFKKKSWPYLIIDILTEFEASEFDAEQRVSFGLSKKSQVETLIKQCYELLNLITFFTTGLDETRGWTLKKGEKAPQAGGVIHTDFETHFIKAEIINWQKLIDSDSFIKARENGLIRTEGKDYIIQDGDVIEIKADA